MAGMYDYYPTGGGLDQLSMSLRGKGGDNVAAGKLVAGKLLGTGLKAAIPAFKAGGLGGAFGAANSAIGGAFPMGFGLLAGLTLMKMLGNNFDAQKFYAQLYNQGVKMPLPNTPYDFTPPEPKMGGINEGWKIPSIQDLAMVNLGYTGAAGRDGALMMGEGDSPINKGVKFNEVYLDENNGGTDTGWVRLNPNDPIYKINAGLGNVPDASTLSSGDWGQQGYGVSLKHYERLKNAARSQLQTASDADRW